MRQQENYQGSEIHRLKPMQENYDRELFEKIYRICKPVIRNLSRQIDCRRYNVSPDIIQSYFWDKMLYVFNKYYGTCTKDHLQAKVLSALSLYKYKLLHAAYGNAAEFNQSLTSLDVLFDNSKEDSSMEDLPNSRAGLLDEIYDYMRDHMSPDTLLVFEAIYNPPPFIQERLASEKSTVTNIMLIDFFELPHTVKSTTFISECREDIRYWLDRARKDLGGKYPVD